MLFSLNYLKKLAHLPKKLADEAIIESFNTLGFEVESITKMPHVKGIKWGKVLKTYKNPHGDHLTVCEIEFSDKKRIIQTTATNVKHGHIIIAFVPGSQCDGFKYGAKTLKKIVSEGMLTAIEEFGLNGNLLFNQTQGISNYQQIDNLAIDPIEYLSLNDTIIDVAILPNRVDAHSYYAMARELAAFFHTKVDKFKEKKASFKSKIKVKNDQTNFLAIMEATNSYQLLFSEKILLIKSGFKIANDINDLANLTFLMTGQPINVYDKDKVGRNWQLTKAIKATAILINDQKFLVSNHLVIRDSKQIIALAGVAGVSSLKPNNQSMQVIFSWGQFDHLSVRNNIKSSKLENILSIQASKLNNLSLMHLASEYLMTKLAHFSAPINLPPLSPMPLIAYNNKQINNIAGFSLTTNKLFKTTLTSLKILGFIQENNYIRPPHYRPDIVSFQDLCEEIFRFYNYNNFLLIPPTLQPKKIKHLTSFDQQFISQGFNQITTYLLTSKEKNQFNPLGFASTLNLMTPISNSRAQIRNSLITSWQDTIIYHVKQKFVRFDFYETSQVNDGINVLSLASSYRSFNAMKMVLSNVFGNIFIFHREKNPYLHPGISAHIYYQTKLVGYIGHLNPHLFDYDIIFVELKLDHLKSQNFSQQNYVERPLKSRDVTINLPPKTSINNTMEIIKKTNGIIDVFIIDKFIDQKLIKVTLKIVGNDQAIDYIDQNFN